MAAGEMDMDKTDFGYTQATTFDHHGSKITAFFIQAREEIGGVLAGDREAGDEWFGCLLGSTGRCRRFCSV